jgi:hypothetical protein
MRAPLSAVAAALILAGCGVAKDRYLAKELEADKYRKSYEAESHRAADLEKKVSDLGARLSAT